MRSVKSSFVALSALGLAMTSGAVAQDRDDMLEQAQASNGWHGVRAIGLGAVSVHEPYRDLEDDPVAFAFPMIAYRNDRFAFQGKQITVRVTPDDSRFEVAALLDYRFQGYNADESPAFEGMEDRNGTLEAGGKINYSLGNLDLSAQSRWDVFDTHGGYDVVLRADYEWRPFIGTWFLPYVGLSYRSSDLANYYYGVEVDEARTFDNFNGTGLSFERNAYETGETMNPFLGMQFRQGLSRNLVVVAFVHHHMLPDEITDSPIVGSDTNTAVGIMFMKPFF